MNNNTKKQIGKKLKEIREKAKLGQKELLYILKKEENLEIAPSTYSSKETGSRKIHLGEAEIFAKVLSKRLNESFWEIYCYIFLADEFTDSKTA